MAQTPQLLDIDVTIEAIAELNKEGSIILEQLNNYELVEISLLIIEPKNEK